MYLYYVCVCVFECIEIFISLPSGIPTSNAIIRTMAIHKTPELVGDVLQCCAKHIEEQKKRGMIE